jgi:two-component system chemotaxis sensor kinase CheA
MKLSSEPGESLLSRNISLLDSVINILKSVDGLQLSDSNLYEMKFYLSSIKSGDEMVFALTESISANISEVLKKSDRKSCDEGILVIKRLLESTRMYLETSGEYNHDYDAAGQSGKENEENTGIEENEENTGIEENEENGKRNKQSENIDKLTGASSGAGMKNPRIDAGRSGRKKVARVEIDPQMLNEFVTDSIENIEESEVALLALESNLSDDNAIDTIFRAFHTIKGSSSYLGFNYLSDMTHHAESLLSKIKDGLIKITPRYADLMLNTIDLIKKMIGKIQKGIQSPPPEYDETLALLINACDGGAEAPVFFAEKRSVNDIYESAPIQDAVNISVESAFTPCDKTNDDGRPVSIIKNSVEVDVISDLIRPGAKHNAVQEPDSTIRVKTDKVDRLIDTVGELVILNSMIFQDPLLKTSKNYELYKKITQAVKMVRELQDISMSMRMIQFKGTFQKMTRLVRDIAKKSDKTVDFITSGSETEVDRNLVDIIDGALVHLLRNAIDHGIERAEERELIGKPAKGTVKLSAFHEGGNVVVEIIDDGAGLNREKIIAKALAKGIIKTSAGLGEDDIFSLIFYPGFSTADTLTDISGRGVGMDVVKTSIEKLKGRIEISSNKGRGSKFTLRMPLTLALTEGMLVRVGGHKFIIPILNIQLTFQAEASKINKFEARQEMIDFQGKTLPIFKLGDIFNVSEAVTDISKGMVIVVNDGKSSSGLLVDEIIGQQQIVAKSLDGEIKNVAGISGGTILSNGRVGLIIDVMEALRLARNK